MDSITQKSIYNDLEKKTMRKTPNVELASEKFAKNMGSQMVPVRSSTDINRRSLEIQ